MSVPVNVTIIRILHGSRQINPEIFPELPS